MEITTREVVRNFSQYAALVETGAEVVILRRGGVKLKLVRDTSIEVDPELRKALIKRALGFQATKPYQGKFKRDDAYAE